MILQYLRLKDFRQSETLTLVIESTCPRLHGESTQPNLRTLVSITTVWYMLAIPWELHTMKYNCLQKDLSLSLSLSLSVSPHSDTTESTYKKIMLNSAWCMSIAIHAYFQYRAIVLSSMNLTGACS